MANVRKIDNSPAGGRHHYLVDANFLLNKHLPHGLAPTPHEQARIKACADWWSKIDKHVRGKRARVYCPDVCIAEAFKGLARKHYREKWFRTYADFAAARESLSADVRVPTKTLKAFDRIIPLHDISTNRDIIISVDRFFELFFKHGKNVQIADMILVATAKYLMDFYDIPKDRSTSSPWTTNSVRRSEWPSICHPLMIRLGRDIGPQSSSPHEGQGFVP